MELERMIRELRERRRYLDRVIAALEQLARLTFSQTTLAKPEPGRRGRKFMTNEERRAVSERMKKYWSTRRPSRNSDKKPKVGPSSAS